MTSLTKKERNSSMTTIKNGEGKLEKVIRYGTVGVLIAFLIWLPFGIQEKQAREEHAWQTQGCEMYDDYTNEDNVPFKCKTYFVDHYKPQQPRVQPPEKK